MSTTKNETKKKNGIHELFAYLRVAGAAEAITFYENRFNIGLTAEEKADLAAFLRAL